MNVQLTHTLSLGHGANVGRPLTLPHVTSRRTMPNVRSVGHYTIVVQKPLPRLSHMQYW